MAHPSVPATEEHRVLRIAARTAMRSTTQPAPSGPPGAKRRKSNEACVAQRNGAPTVGREQRDAESVRGLLGAVMYLGDPPYGRRKVASPIMGGP